MNEENNARLASLRNFSKNEETLKMAAQRREQEKREALIQKICTLAPRIDELIATGNACLENNIPLTGHSYGLHEGYETHQFFTNSWSHLVGFVGNPHSQPCHIRYLGINGGGACGVYNFRTDGQNVFSVHEDNPYDISAPSIFHMQNFLERFESFESHFYAYVDSVIEKQRQSVDKLISSANERVNHQGDERQRNSPHQER